MNGRDIPGYYFDQEKKKYFKILPNHLSPTGSRYSRESVEQQKKEQTKHEQEATKSALRRRQRVETAHVLTSSPAAGIGLQRELGGSACFDKQRDASAAACTAGWEISTLALEENDKISNFIVDEATGVLIYGIPNNRGGGWNPYVSLCPSKDKEGRYHYPPATRRHIGNALSVISSFSLSPNRVLLTTSLGNFHPPLIRITALLDPDDITPQHPVDQGFSTELRPAAEHQTIWTSAANPWSDDMFAVGTSAGVLDLRTTEGGWNGSLRLQTKIDVLALDWLTVHILAVGRRDGVLMLWDARSNGSTIRLRHPGVIWGIRRVDENKVVVCGLQNSLAMYDFRMPRIRSLEPDSDRDAKRQDTTSTMPTQARKRKRRELLGSQFTQPVIRYDYANAYRPLGFDISTSLGVVAAAEEDKRVALFSLHTGARLPHRLNVSRVDRPDNAKTHHPEDEGWVRHLRFTKDERNGGEKLLATSGKQILQYAW